MRDIEQSKENRYTKPIKRLLPFIGQLSDWEVTISVCRSFPLILFFPIILSKKEHRMHKQFIPYDAIRNGGFQLARRIWDDGFIPNILYTSLRGGAYLGNAIHEWFKLVNKTGSPMLYAAVVAHSYSDRNEQTKMIVDGWTYPPEYLRSGDKILLVDDIFDSGATMNYLVSVFLEKGIPRSDIKIAVYDYKVFHGSKTQHEAIQPDYWCKKHDINDGDDSLWIHYLSHELLGLTPDELEKHYFSLYPELRETFQGII